MENKFGGSLYISKVFNYLYIGAGLSLFLYLFAETGLERRFDLASGDQVLPTVWGIVMLCIFLLMIKILQTKEYKIKITTVDCIIFCYGVYILMLPATPYAAQHWVEYFVLAFTYLYFRNINTHSVYIFFIAISICSLWQIAYGYQQLSMPWHTISDNKGIFFNTGIFGHLLAVSCILIISGIYYGIEHKKKPVILLTSICLLLAITQLAATQSRASWVAIFAGLLVMGLSKFKPGDFFRRLNIYIRIVLILAILAFSVFSVYYLYSIKTDSANGRVLIWTVSANIFKESPITGKGLNSFEANYMDAQSVFFANNPNHHFEMLADDIFVPFNEYIKIGVEQGVTGLLFALLLIFFLIFRTKEASGNVARKALLTTTKSAFAVILVTALFSYPFEVLQFKVLSIFLIAVLSKYSTGIALFDKIKLAPTAYKYAKTGICSLLILLSIFVSIQAYNLRVGINKWEAIMRTPMEERISLLHLFEGIYPELKNNPAFLVTYSRSLERKGDYVGAIRLLKETEAIRPSYSICIELGELHYKTGDYDMAIHHWSKAANMIPARFEPLYRMAKLYHEQGNYEAAKEKACLFMNKKIKKDSPALRRMKEYMEQILYSDEENLFISRKY
jgi:O-antigen ligase